MENSGTEFGFPNIRCQNIFWFCLGRTHFIASGEESALLEADQSQFSKRVVLS